MNMISLDCPKCGASLSTNGDREFFFCQNCGNKIILQNENEYIIRHVEDVDAIQAKTDQYVQMKKMDMLDKLQANRNRGKTGKIVLTIILALIGAALALVGVIVSIFAGEFSTGSIIAFFGALCSFAIAATVWENKDKYEDEVARLEGKVKTPDVFDDIKRKKYQQIEGAFRNAGFTNITCQKRNDLTIGLRHRADTVATVMINGEEISEGGKWYQPSSPVVIVYHAYVWTRN